MKGHGLQAAYGEALAVLEEMVELTTVAGEIRPGVFQRYPELALSSLRSPATLFTKYAFC